MKNRIFKLRYFAQKPVDVGRDTLSYLERYSRDNILPTKSDIMNSLTKWDIKQNKNNSDEYNAQLTKTKYTLSDLDT